MTYLIAFIAGIVGAVFGWAAAAALTLLIAGYLGVSDFEGQRAMGAIFGIGPIGGIVGLAAGVALVLSRRGGHSAGGIAWRLPLVVVGIAGASAAGMWWLYETRQDLNSNGPPPRLAFEVRLPPGLEPPAPSSVRIELHTAKNRMPGRLVDAPSRSEDGRAVLVGEIDVHYRSSWRLLELKVPEQAGRLFKLDLPARPRRTTAFDRWEHAQFVIEPDGGQPSKTGPGEGFEIRYRMIWPEVPR
jgi:hypothetical protein